MERKPNKNKIKTLSFKENKNKTKKTVNTGWVF